MPIFYGVMGRKELSANVFNNSMKELKSNIKVLDTHLSGNYYLVGDNVTIADIVLATYLVIPFQTVFDGGYRKAVPNVTEWFERVTRLPSVVKTCGYIKLVEKAFK